MWSLRRKTKNWPVIFISDAASGRDNTERFGESLGAIVTKQITPQRLSKAIDDLASGVELSGDASEVKAKLGGNSTARKMKESMALLHEMQEAGLVGQNEALKQLTLGDMVVIWARLTGQDPAKLFEKLKPRIDRLVKEWWDKTGCSGLTDKEVSQHPEDAARFFTGLHRVLLAETSDENLAHTLRVLLSLLRKNRIRIAPVGDLIHKATRLMVWRTARQARILIETHPELKPRITAPEFAALVELEKEKQGLGGDIPGAIELLRKRSDGKLKALCEETDETAIAAGLKSVAKQSLTSNLMEAVKGQLKDRLISAISGATYKVHGAVVSTWQFLSSASEDGFGITGCDISKSDWWAAYARQSTREQSENDRLGEYLLSCTRLAKQHGAIIPREYIIYDARSSEDMDRPGIKMLRSELIAKRRIEGIVIPFQGRLSSGPLHQLTFEKECEYYGLKVIYGDAPPVMIGVVRRPGSFRLRQMLCESNVNRDNALGGSIARVMAGKVPA